MLPLFQKPEQSRQREELLTRKKLLREINGQEIDRIKGVEAKGPDKDTWLRYWQIDPDDDDATKAEKYYHNSLVISKKPYFFRYLYPELNKKYKQYESSYNDKSKALFGIKLKKLLGKPVKSEAEATLVKRYHKFSPLINTNCIMNILCRTIEDIDFENRECVVFGKGSKERLVYFDARTKIHLQNYLDSRTDNNPALFVSLRAPYNRLMIGGVESRLRELGCQLNLPKVHPHKFRRTLATSAIDKGMPIEQVQQLLGHQKIDTTMHYAMVKQQNVKLAHRKYIG